MSNFFNVWKSKGGSDKNVDSSKTPSTTKHDFDDDAGDSNWQNARAKTERMSVSRSGRYKERQRRRSSLFDAETSGSKMAAANEEQRHQQQRPHPVTATTTRAHSRSGSNSSGNNQYQKTENNENIHNAKLSVGKNSTKERGSIDRVQQNHKDLPLQSVAI